MKDAALEFLAARAGGDARTALSALELATETVGPEGTVTLAVAEDALQRRAVLYDKQGDKHYDLISAWIKSTRGSDPDASLLYLAAMLEGGEDARFIARRMVVLASEDIGNADPRALQVAIAAAQAVEHVGLPEAALNLAQAADYLALAPKSNASTTAIGRAREWVREHGAPVPPHYLQSAAYPGAKKLGRGIGYDFPHAYPEGVSEQELMPDEAIGERFLELSSTARRRSCASGSRASAGHAGASSLGFGHNLLRWRPSQTGRGAAGQARVVQPARRGPARRGADDRAIRGPGGRGRRGRRAGLLGAAPARRPARYMRRAGQAIIDQLDELAELLTREQGKPRNESYVMELLPTIDSLRWLADAGRGSSRTSASRCRSS